jgi:DDE family transposase
LPVREPVAPPRDENQGALFCLRLEAEEIVDRSSGRRGWLRAARQQLDRHRELETRPVQCSRIERLLEAERRLSEELEVEHEANRIYQAWRARGIALDGSKRMAPGTTKPYQPPAEPEGKINLTDPDCRLQKVRQGWVQGHNAQAVANEQQIVLAAEITVDSPDFGHLGPMIEATERQLTSVGIEERPAVIVADAGYWHQDQMDEIVSRGMQVLIPPDAKMQRRSRRLDRRRLRLDAHRPCPRTRPRALQPPVGDDRASVRRREAQPQDRPLPTKRQSRRLIGVATDQRHPQPPETPPPPARGRHRVKPEPGGPTW